MSSLTYLLNCSVSLLYLARTERSNFMCLSPDFTIALIRTPFLPPRYASFYVPLSFNKLDMRDYLQRLYGVDVLGVRSYVEQQKLTRMKPMGKYGYGKLRRPESRKRMTVEMTQPFVWPETPKDMAPYVYTYLCVVMVEVKGGANLITDGNTINTSRPPSTNPISKIRIVPTQKWSPISPSRSPLRNRRSRSWTRSRRGNRPGRRWV